MLLSFKLSSYMNLYLDLFAGLYVGSSVVFNGYGSHRKLICHMIRRTLAEFICKFASAWFVPKANSLGETVEAAGCEYLFIDCNRDEQAFLPTGKNT